MRRIVFMYHDVYSVSNTESGFQFPNSFPYKISAQKFEEHVKFVYDYCKQNKLPLDTIEFTFDDGGESFFRVIAPILEKYGFKGVFFISSSYLNTNKFLTSDQVRDLHKKGHIVASHSHTHPRNMTLLSEKEMLSEWKDSLKMLSAIIEAPVSVASIPCGFCSQSVVETARNAGIKTLYTSIPSDKLMYWGDMRIVGRYVVLCNTSTNYINKIINSNWTRKKLIIRWKVLAFAKRVLGTYYYKIKNSIVR